MHIPMFFFTIIIERPVVSAEEKEARLKQQQAVEKWEENRIREAAQYPEYCIRL